MPLCGRSWYRRSLYWLSHHQQQIITTRNLIAIINIIHFEAPSSFIKQIWVIFPFHWFSIFYINYFTNKWTWSIQPAMLETSSKTNQLPTSFRFIGKQGMKGALYFMDPTVNRYHQSCWNHGNVCEVIKTTSRHRFITPDSWQRLSHTNRL